jgi:hypothetical protein
VNRPPCAALPGLAWLVGAAVALAGSAGAQTRPLLTETAATAPAGTVTLEAGLDFFAAEPNFLTGRERDRWDVPVLRLVFSPAANVELDLEWTARVIARDDPDFGDVSDWGDVTLRSKVRLMGDGEHGPILGARFTLTLPETSFGNGLGPNVLRMSAQALLTQRLGRLTLHANAGLGIHEEVLRPHEQRDFLAYGLALERRAGSKLTIAVEAAGRAGNGMAGADQRGEVRAGFRFGGRRAGDVAVRRALTHADGSWGFTFGFSWTLREGRWDDAAKPAERSREG